MVEAAKTDVPDAVVVVDPVPKSTVEPETVPQFCPVMLVPVQNVSASFTSSETWICTDVLKATFAVSIAVVHAASE